MKIKSLSLLLLACATAWPQRSGAIDLLERYPTSLTAGDRSPYRSREWEFAKTDIFHLSRFQFELGNDLKMETGPADVGLGHCGDGAVWAAVIPQESGTVSRGTTNRESIAHIWLRFHPRDVNRLFPPETVSAAGAARLAAQIRFIANAKMRSSYHAGMRALIPAPNDFMLDVDTTGGLRRLFRVDTKAKTVDASEMQAVRMPPAITPELAAQAFDQLWETFDRDYAMFGLRPEVDWNKSRQQFRPRALASKSGFELADVLAEMLKPLRDLHVSLKVSGIDMPVFDRPRAYNSNPAAHRAVLGDLRGQGYVQWAVTPDKIGFIATYDWIPGRGIAEQCDAALEGVRDTRALIVDVRLNRGGSENVAREFAGRFLADEFTYASHQRRNGPAHTDLTGKVSRTVEPRGPWRYERPVLLLIGERCISSNESFIGMMTGATNVTTMGARTAGSSGNPQELKLPLDITVGVPIWITYLPDGAPLDERGYQPQIKFEPREDAFGENRDDLLAAALERLRQVPLPAKPVQAN